MKHEKKYSVMYTICRVVYGICNMWGGVGAMKKLII